MQYLLIHRYEPAAPHKTRAVPYSTVPEAVIQACSLIAADQKGDFEIRNEKGDVMVNDGEIRNRCKQTRMP
jgi:hypothetical protein